MTLGIVDKNAFDDFHRDVSAKRKVGEAWVEVLISWLTTPDIDLFSICTQTTEDHVTYLLLGWNSDKFIERTNFHEWPEGMLNLIERLTHIKVRSLVGYCIKGCIIKPYISEYEHRALYVDNDIKWIGASDFLYSTMNELTETPKKEITYVPSILYFYMKRGFEIDKLHIVTEWQNESPKYSLTNEQKKEVNDIILWCLQKGDLSLPFFVELKYTWRIPSNINSDAITIPHWLSEIIDMYQILSDKWYRSFFFQDRDMCNLLERFLWISSQRINP